MIDDGHCHTDDLTWWNINVDDESTDDGHCDVVDDNDEMLTINDETTVRVSFEPV